jgi:hypothetical protein
MYNYIKTMYGLGKPPVRIEKLSTRKRTQRKDGLSNSKDYSSSSFQMFH